MCSEFQSVGIAVYRRGQRPEDLIRLADEVLYKAKGAGKNTIHIA